MKYFTLLLIIFTLFNCDKSKFDPLAKVKKRKAYKGPSSVHYNFAQYVYDKKRHKPTVIIKGEVARFYKLKAVAELSKVTVFYRKFYDNNPRQNERRVKLTKLTCNTAVIFEREKIFIGKGNVIIVSNNGVRMETNKIYYDEKKNMLYTDKDEKVIIYNENGSITKGYYLRSDPGFSKIMLDRQKTVTPNRMKKKPPNRS